MAAAAYSCPPASSFRRPGSRWPSMTDDVQVQRFNADGSIASASPAFDYSGAVGLDQARDSAGAVARQTYGQAVVGGANFFGTSPFGLARVKPAGSQNACFANGGALSTPRNANYDAESVS